jgi:hypothetical protein
MSNILLSILIPTIHERRLQFNALMARLYKEIGDMKAFGLVVVQWEVDDKQMTIGEKRNILYAKSDGMYSLMLDDDDDLVPGAIAKILMALGTGPDCVTYLESCSMNGKKYLSNHSLLYQNWAENYDGYDFVRTPYFKDVILTEIARRVPVPPVRYGEDHIWSINLKPHLRTQVHLDEIIYLYQHESKPENFNQRYGIK